MPSTAIAILIAAMEHNKAKSLIDRSARLRRELAKLEAEIAKHLNLMQKKLPSDAGSEGTAKVKRKR